MVKDAVMPILSLLTLLLIAFLASRSFDIFGWS